MERKITPEHIMEFRNYLIRDEKSAATVKKYIRDVEAFRDYLDGKTVNKELVIQYKQEIAENYSPHTVNAMLAAINSFMKYYGWHDCPVKALKIQPTSFRAVDRELTKEEYFRLLNAAMQKNNLRLFWLMQTICSTGIRVSELKFITVEAINNGIIMVSLKGKTRQVLIPRVLVKELSLYVQKEKIETGSIFVTRNGKPMDRSNILHEMKALCPLAKVEKSKVFPHNLRHLFACSFYSEKKDLSRLADILGHSSINTTRIYTSVSVREQQSQIDNLGLVVCKKIIPQNNHFEVKAKMGKSDKSIKNEIKKEVCH